MNRNIMHRALVERDSCVYVDIRAKTLVRFSCCLCLFSTWRFTCEGREPRCIFPSPPVLCVYTYIYVCVCVCVCVISFRVLFSVIVSPGLQRCFVIVFVLPCMFLFAVRMRMCTETSVYHYLFHANLLFLQSNAHACCDAVML